MTMTYDDWAYDEMSVELHEEELREAQSALTTDRLRAAFRQDARAPLPAVLALQRARRLLTTDPTAACTFAVVAMEVSIKRSVLRPALAALLQPRSRLQSHWLRRSCRS